jgi:hypothetical protein
MPKVFVGYSTTARSYSPICLTLEPVSEAEQTNEQVGRGDATLRTHAEFDMLFADLSGGADILRVRDDTGALTPEGRIVKELRQAAIGADARPRTITFTTLERAALTLGCVASLCRPTTEPSLRERKVCGQA